MKNFIEVIKIGISLIALVASGFSIWLSNYYHTESKTEHINIVASSVQSNFTTKLISLGENIVIPCYWELILSNNSDKTISITNIDVEEILNEGIISGYPHLYDGIYNSIYRYNEDMIELPININSGESRKIYARIGVRCSKQSSNHLKSDFFSTKPNSENFEPWVRLNQVKISLAKSNIDFYDNFDNVEYSNEDIHYYTSDAGKQQCFRMNVYTGKNNVASKILQFYMSKQ